MKCDFIADDINVIYNLEHTEVTEERKKKKPVLLLYETKIIVISFFKRLEKIIAKNAKKIRIIDLIVKKLFGFGVLSI